MCSMLKDPITNSYHKGRSHDPEEVARGDGTMKSKRVDQHEEVSRSKAFCIDNNSANVVQVDSAQVDTERGKI